VTRGVDLTTPLADDDRTGAARSNFAERQGEAGIATLSGLCYPQWQQASGGR